MAGPRLVVNEWVTRFEGDCETRCNALRGRQRWTTRDNARMRYRPQRQKGREWGGEESGTNCGMKSAPSESENRVPSRAKMR
jgi:hypothetical protein